MICNGIWDAEGRAYARGWETWAYNVFLSVPEPMTDLRHGHLWLMRRGNKYAVVWTWECQQLCLTDCNPDPAKIPWAEKFELKHLRHERDAFLRDLSDHLQRCAQCLQNLQGWEVPDEPEPQKASHDPR